MTDERLPEKDTGHEQEAPDASGAEPYEPPRGEVLTDEGSAATAAWIGTGKQ
jgi:hypothetical protein